MGSSSGLAPPVRGLSGQGCCGHGCVGSCGRAGPTSGAAAGASGAALPGRLNGAASAGDAAGCSPGTRVSGGVLAELQGGLGSPGSRGCGGR
eukprot:13373901-Alexandrium_andersonii.AAC.1